MPGWKFRILCLSAGRSRNLDGRLHIMFGLSDEELAALYDRCLFTVFPSFVEGWGLPVGESLAHGKICVASSTTSIPEVGGELVVYVDPFNLESGYNTISGLINNPALLTQLESKLKTSFVARTWNDVGKDFFLQIDRVMNDFNHRQEPRVIYAPTLNSGEFLDVTNMHNVGARGAAYVANPDRLAFAEGWRGVETTGTWMRDQVAKLRLRTNCHSGQALSVLVRVGTSPWVSKQNTLRVSASGTFSKRRLQDKSTYNYPMRENADLWLKLAGKVDETGYLTIYFGVDGDIKSDKPSNVPVALRLHAVGYAASDDMMARLNLLEQVLVFSN